jgi:hypothetical protein
MHWSQSESRYVVCHFYILGTSSVPPQCHNSCNRDFLHKIQICSASVLISKTPGHITVDDICNADTLLPLRLQD